MLALDVSLLVLLPLELFPLDIPPDAPRPTSFAFLTPLLVVLVALVAMVGLLFWIRRKRKS